jgi:hypothetical protein
VLEKDANEEDDDEHCFVTFWDDRPSWWRFFKFGKKIHSRWKP